MTSFPSPSRTGGECFENEGRRIKRSIFVDMQTIDFVDEARMERFKRIRLIQEYLAAKVREVEAGEQGNGP